MTCFVFSSFSPSIPLLLLTLNRLLKNTHLVVMRTNCVWKLHATNLNSLDREPQQRGR